MPISSSWLANDVVLISSRHDQARRRRSFSEPVAVHAHGATVAARLLCQIGIHSMLNRYMLNRYVMVAASKWRRVLSDSATWLIAVDSCYYHTELQLASDDRTEN
jgi:hypothetical protein